MELQWAEDEKLDEILERRRIEGSSLKADVMQKVLESAVHERMGQGNKVTGAKGNKKVKGWSTEEVKDKQNISLEEDTEEMCTWRGLSQNEVDQCWKKLAEKWKRKFWTSTRSKKAKEWPSEREVPRWNGDGCAKTRNTEKESGAKIPGQKFFLVERIQLAASAM